MLYWVENLSLFTLIYLCHGLGCSNTGWESFIIHLDILNRPWREAKESLRIFHYSPWYTYRLGVVDLRGVENLSLFTLIYLALACTPFSYRWESFIIHLDILNAPGGLPLHPLRIFHYSPWYTYCALTSHCCAVENLSLFTLIYLGAQPHQLQSGWESFIIHLDILRRSHLMHWVRLRIFHYSPWYT